MNTQRVEGHTQTIKDCPCCGDEAYDTASGCIMCGTCGLHAESIETWNRRASIERLEKVNEALVMALEAFVEACEKAPPLELMAHIDAACVKSRAALKLAKEPA